LNYSYSISGWARGDKIPANAFCSFSIEFDMSPSGQPVMCRNKEYLESVIKSRMQFGLAKQVPINVGEFGLYRDCFMNGHNGIQWVKDVLDILSQYHLNFTYHCYHQYPMGIYYNDGSLPDPNQCNQELITLFKNTLPTLQ
jgi:endoglucanase